MLEKFVMPDPINADQVETEQHPYHWNGQLWTIFGFDLEPGLVLAQRGYFEFQNQQSDRDRYNRITEIADSINLELFAVMGNGLAL